MAKKFTSILLAVSVLITASAGIGAVGAAEENEKTEVGRYYFYMPEEWAAHNGEQLVVTCTAEDLSSFDMNAEKSDNKNVWYCDVPSDISEISWSESGDGSTYYTRKITVEYYDSDDSELYPNGIDSFGKMIYVTGGRLLGTDNYVYSGEWYYYYGSGIYGDEPTVEQAVSAGGFYNTSECLPETQKIVLGDVNENGKIDILDVTEIQKYLANLNSMSDIRLLLADANADNAVSILDATEIQKYLAQLIDILG